MWFCINLDVLRASTPLLATTAPTGNQARHQSQPNAISVTPATQSAAATTAPTGNQARHQSQPSAISATPATQVKVNVAKCHACHAKRRSMSPSATPAAQSEGRCRQVPRLPCKTKVGVTKRHACHAKCRGDNGAHREPSASPEPAQCHKCHACHARSMSPSATPATQNEGRCHQAPHLPRKVPRRQRRPPGTKRITRASPVPYLVVAFRLGHLQVLAITLATPLQPWCSMLQVR